MTINRYLRKLFYGLVLNFSTRDAIEIRNNIQELVDEKLLEGTDEGQIISELGDRRQIIANYNDEVSNIHPLRRLFQLIVSVIALFYSGVYLLNAVVTPDDYVIGTLFVFITTIGLWLFVGADLRLGSEGAPWYSFRTTGLIISILAFYDIMLLFYVHYIGINGEFILVQNFYRLISLMYLIIILVCIIEITRLIRRFLKAGINSFHFVFIIVGVMNSVFALYVLGVDGYSSLYENILSIGLSHTPLFVGIICSLITVRISSVKGVGIR